eukprot:TRINITY_DN3511_c0_g1_i2.p1 TRINITY_DN3511_c0_g1~~TRINITY_DN3511_c0_g1_i2.p1  ORF type:complete len:280 (+),score=63.52 TRINITY_DN3511_c0_g1_i2:727-1566(+)
MSYCYLQTISYYISYDVSHSILNANCLVPQNRPRIYIVGFLKHLSIQFKFPVIPNHHPKVSDILEKNVSPSYNLSPSQWEKIKTSPSYLKKPESRIANPNSVARCLCASYKTGFGVNSQFVRVNWGKPVPTTLAEDECPRFFTPREAARLMGFPDSFDVDLGGHDVGGFYHLAGNAVVPPIIQEIVKAILNSLEQGDKKPILSQDPPGPPRSIEEHVHQDWHKCNRTHGECAIWGSDGVYVIPECILCKNLRQFSGWKCNNKDCKALICDKCFQQTKLN